MKMQKLQISDLRHRVTIQTWTRTPDGAGGYIEEWSDLTKVWAQIEPVFNVTQSKEKIEAQQEKPVLTHKVRIRFLKDMTPDKRLKWGERILEPRSVIDEEGRGKTMLMFCDEEL